MSKCGQAKLIGQVVCYVKRLPVLDFSQLQGQNQRYHRPFVRGGEPPTKSGKGQLGDSLPSFQVPQVDAAAPGFGPADVGQQLTARCEGNLPAAFARGQSILLPAFGQMKHGHAAGFDFVCCEPCPTRESALEPADECPTRVYEPPAPRAHSRLPAPNSVRHHQPVDGRVPCRRER